VPIAMSDRDFLLEVFRSQEIDPANVDLYAREYRFDEAGRSYWLPVQTGVAAFFPKELKPGQKVDLYARLAGAYGPHGALTLVALVEEFNAATP
jgi:hypothetical protein